MRQLLEMIAAPSRARQRAAKRAAACRAAITAGMLCAITVGLPGAGSVALAQNRSTPPVTAPVTPPRASAVDERMRNAIRMTRPLPLLVANVLAQPEYRGMEYIGVENFDVATGRYRLRFLDRRQLYVVAVDGRTGRVLGSVSR